ncbi:unnamed protein product [Ambrosiozyma monospora]|uniref:Unnamed protein product n=1 Tax=Ambrosiozyma monospora TaxID=43982 RepID=A0A9W6WG75_AMBMO|nr:unnamed protein product [Ambrosiozyma monospora]
MKHLKKLEQMRKLMKLEQMKRMRHLMKLGRTNIPNQLEFSDNNTGTGQIFRQDTNVNLLVIDIQIISQFEVVTVVNSVVRGSNSLTINGEKEVLRNVINFLASNGVVFKTVSST